MRKGVALDCDIDNECKAKSYVRCSKRGKLCDTGLAFNKHLCSDCNHIEYCDPTSARALMGDTFVEIDEQDLFDALKRLNNILKIRKRTST